ncbi:MAG TPA: UbiA-like polyprenyltransferase [Bacteroidia bacterium]|nr:UbiA-like polyprenyltransferase [Bacteroidia bacterium]
MNGTTTHKTKVGDYFSLVAFSHTIFAMPFAMVGFLYAIHRYDYEFSWKLLGLVVLCMIFARNAAMGFNRYADRDIDAQNARTQVREIPSGKVSPNAALWFVIANCVCFIGTTYFINPICFYLSPVALSVILGYSITKRYTALCHLVLGLGLSLAPIGAWLAVTGRFDMFPLWYSFAVLFWVSGFDIIYALQDEEFDRTNGLNSIPAFLGKKRALNLSRIFHVIAAVCIWLPSFLEYFGLLYYLGATAFTALLVYQHRLVSPTDLSKVNRAFFTTNGIASVVFGTLVIADIYLTIRLF